MVKVISRDEWGALSFTCSEPLPQIDAIVVHYTASDADEQAEHGNCAARVRAIQRFHMSSSPSDPSKPWCDIAYNFLVCKHGFVFVGRGWKRKSGATGPANSHTISVCFLGDDTARRDDVTADGRTALGWWVRRALERFPGSSVRGHRNFTATACPGDELMRWIRNRGWERRVRFELWARRKVDGEWKLHRVTASRPVRVGGGRPRARAKKFVARSATRLAKLAARNRRPRIRRVKV
jgi:N-acetylmuramoyl-L-alanine amidase